LLLQIGVVLAAAHLLGIVFHRFGQPRVMGEMTAGILLGPSLLGRVAPSAFAHLFPANGLGALNALSQIGLILFLFVVGIHVRPREIRELRGPAISASAASILTPFALGGLLAIPLHRELARAVPLPTFVLFMGAAMSITAFPVLARILTERGLLNTRAGAIAISCAAVDDVVAWCFVALLMAASAAAWLLSLAGFVVYGAAMLFAVRPLLRRDAPNLATALLVLLASSWATETLGVHALFGAFVAGLAMPRDTEVPKAVEPLTSTFLLPLFFAFTGLRMNIALVSGATLWFYCATIIVVAVLGKLFGCALTLRARGLPWRESLTVGTLVNTRGLIELVVLNIGLERNIISPTLFSMMVLMALVTTFMTTPLLAMVNPGLESG
jgi:Kef-type K+ transport system membrane component KefB